MLMGLDTDTHEDDVESVIDEDTGETMLYRIEVKNGKRFRTRVGTKQGPKAAGNRDCYRCGRPGHFGRDCKARSHKDGGPVRMPTGRGRSTAALDDEEEAGDPAGPAAPRNPAPAAGPDAGRRAD